MTYATYEDPVDRAPETLPVSPNQWILVGVLCGILVAGRGVLLLTFFLFSNIMTFLLICLGVL